MHELACVTDCGDVIMCLCTDTNLRSFTVWHLYSCVVVCHFRSHCVFHVTMRSSKIAKSCFGSPTVNFRAQAVLHINVEQWLMV